MKIQKSMLFFSRYVYDGLEGLGPDMEKFHARINQSQLKMMKKGHNMFFDDTDYTDRMGIMSRIMTEDHCIDKIINVNEDKFKQNTVPIFDKALLAHWAKKYLPSEEKELIFELAKSLQVELEEVFKENTWMNRKSKENAIEKLQNFILNLGYPNEIFDEEKMKSYHAKFFVETLDSGAFIENQVFINPT